MASALGQRESGLKVCMYSAAVRSCCRPHRIIDWSSILHFSGSCIVFPCSCSTTIGSDDEGDEVSTAISGNSSADDNNKQYVSSLQKQNQVLCEYYSNIVTALAPRRQPDEEYEKKQNAPSLSAADHTQQRYDSAALRQSIFLATMTLADVSIITNTGDHSK